MHPNEQLIHDFYTAFQQLDWQAMAALYTRDACFSDPVFCDLKGSDIAAMWHMLCLKAENFELSFGDIKADDNEGSARWEAHYTFSPSGGGRARRVHNIIFAEFQFAEGKISRHSDHFSFWRWSSMALGPAGRLLGWSGPIKRKVQSQAVVGLKSFMRKAGYGKSGPG
ncbi:hypothetical protein MNBD_GAMMA09-2633 [hydrothermal vent metagenome]|uniref:SnoaL-like domain-containing protein n=1 Tax=hydrothermal vent metagenome TaxID=652676 RepID=A0A3B0XI87_9ZZZZ